MKGGTMMMSKEVLCVAIVMMEGGIVEGAE
jgi:hypothetical protein